MFAKRSLWYKKNDEATQFHWHRIWKGGKSYFISNIE